jgi:hypothetical protein
MFVRQENIYCACAEPHSRFAAVLLLYKLVSILSSRWQISGEDCDLFLSRPILRSGLTYVQPPSLSTYRRDSDIIAEQPLYSYYRVGLRKLQDTERLLLWSRHFATRSPLAAAARNTFLLQLQTNFESFPNNCCISRDCRLTGYFIINMWKCYLLFEFPCISAVGMRKLSPSYSGWCLFQNTLKISIRVQENMSELIIKMFFVAFL